MSFTKVTSAGIGSTELVTLDSLEVINNASIGGVLTYEDVTNVDSVGIITARAGVLVGSGITLSKDGDVFFTGIATGNGSGLTNLPAANLTGTLPAISGANLTNLDASDLASGTVPTARLGSGTASSSTFLRGDSSFQTVDTDLVSDTSPQLGGNLDVNTKNITFGDSGSASDDRLTFGAGTDLSIYHDGSHSYISEQGTGNLRILTSSVFTVNNAANSENMILATDGGSVDLYFNGVKKLETTTIGVTISGDLKLPDNEEVRLGDGNDLQLYHNGSQSYVTNNTGNLNLTSAGAVVTKVNTNEDAIVCNANGSVDLYHDNVKKLETDAGGIKLPSEAGGAQLKVGASGDFTIEHDGSNTYIKNTTGNTVIQNDAVVEITASSGGTKRFRFDSDGLKFGSDTAAANALDDYEEGTFTPRLGGSSNSSTYFVSGYGWYRKIGRMVYTCVRFNGVDLDNNAAGDVKIHNLPYTCNSAASNTDSITSDASYFNVVFNTSHQYAWYASNGGTSWVGLVSRNNTSWDSWNVSDFHASSLYINFSGWYQTDS